MGEIGGNGSREGRGRRRRVGGLMCERVGERKREWFRSGKEWGEEKWSGEILPDPSSVSSESGLLCLERREGGNGGRTPNCKKWAKRKG